MNIVAEKEKLPFRVENLKNKLKGMNGDPLTEVQSRDMIKMIGESHVDLWNEFLEMKALLKTIANIGVGIIMTVSAGLILWFLTAVLPNIT